MSAAPGVSRRDLFSRGAARLVPGREDLAAVGAAWRGYHDAQNGVEQADPEAFAARVRAVGDRLVAAAAAAPAAHALVEAAGVRAGETVLDAAAGAGNVALAAAARGARVTALDLSPKTVEAGRARCAAGAAGVEWTVGDVERMPFADGTFDRVLSCFGAMYAPRPRAAAAELARVTRRGGSVAMATWTSAGFIGRVLDVAARLDPPPPVVPRASRWGRYESAFLWLGSVVEGFEMRDDRTLELPFASADAAWESLATAPPMAAAAPERHDEARRCVVELVEHFGETRPGGGVSVEAGYCVLTGVRP